MHKVIPFLLVLCAPAHAQNFPEYLPYEPSISKCNMSENLDSWILEPSENQGEYLFTYINNLSECSNSWNGIGVTSEDGFKVILYVEVGVNDADDERIYVIPQDPQYMAYPAEILAPDSSEPYTIRLIPGVS